LVIPNMARPQNTAAANNPQTGASQKGVARGLLVVLLALTLVPSALADSKRVKPADRAAINKLLDEFIPAVVEQKDLKRGWDLVAGVEKNVSYKDWVRGNTPVQAYPAKGTTFHGWLVNYSSPGDVGFDILLQPTSRKLGAWSFRAEAQKLGGKWRITTWYPVATYAPPAAGKTQTVLGPNDLGPGNGAASSTTPKGRLGPWVLAVPGAALLVLALGALSFAGVRWARQRRRIRAIEQLLARD
jgi:hypothetical protein